MRYFSVTLLFVVSLFLSEETMAACARYEGTVGNSQALSVSADSFNIRADDPKGPQFITTLGTLKNPGVSCFTDIVVEVKYFDAKGTLIDTVTQELDAVVVPGGQEAAFRTIAPPARRKEDYASQSVRVVSGRETPSNARPSERPFEAKVRELVYAFGPVILLMLIWWFFMRLYLRNKKSPQNRTLAVLESQLPILERKNELLARIAVALEERAKK